MPLFLLLTALISSGCQSKTETASKPTVDKAGPVIAMSDQQKSELSPNLKDLVARLQRLQSEQTPDGLELEPLFDDVDLEKLSKEERRELRTIVIDSIETWENWSREKHPVRDDPEEEKRIFEALGRKEFDADPRIAESDIYQIIDCLQKHPSLDPRILNLKFIDENTISIMTGEVRGPLDGGGSYYMARRENGRWVIRQAGSWVS